MRGAGRQRVNWLFETVGTEVLHDFPGFFVRSCTEDAFNRLVEVTQARVDVIYGIGDSFYAIDELYHEFGGVVASVCYQG